MEWLIWILILLLTQQERIFLKNSGEDGEEDQGENPETPDNINGESDNETETSLDDKKDTVNQQEKGKGNLLPNTATMTYNLIIVGFIIVCERVCCFL
ncbi:hypothetical protein AB3U99_18685 [Niallia sp. JL1B1071]|uniref:hypothetical protein n=1 Tax=Niallia tiangongensis TaxID=3237105 RepID=UPI0037DDA77B